MDNRTRAGGRGDACSSFRCFCRRSTADGRHPAKSRWMHYQLICEAVLLSQIQSRSCLEIRRVQQYLDIYHCSRHLVVEGHALELEEDHSQYFHLAGLHFF